MARQPKSTSSKTSKTATQRAVFCHTEWLSLIDVSGGFLDADVLNEQKICGLDRLALGDVQATCQRYDAWRGMVDTHDADAPQVHRLWLDFVIYTLLGYDACDLRDVTDGHLTGPENQRFDASRAIVRDGKTAVYVCELAPDTPIHTPPADHWQLTFAERMAQLCRLRDVRLGLVTNGEQWCIVYAPGDIHESASYATWHARLWTQERDTLHAFAMFMGIKRAFGPETERLEALVEASRKGQKSVSETLESQVSGAIEVLIRCLDRADADRNGTLLKDVNAREVYEAALTVMMRLVFILCAEERRLLLLGDPVYDAHYAISTLRDQLLYDQSDLGDAVLERRYDAWTRLLATFRAVYGGIGHPNLRMPALGGSIFDPDKYPFLEGRDHTTSWVNTPANPLPIDNRTVLLLLNALQVLVRKTGAQTISYRTLDVEQIGHVYEGLLELTIMKADDVMLAVKLDDRIKNNPLTQCVCAYTPNGELLSLSRLETLIFDENIDLTHCLKKQPGRRDTARLRTALRRVCLGDALFGRIQNLFGDKDAVYAYLRLDAWGDPCVFQKGNFMLVTGTTRRETGAHYTPRFLTEQIVATTLEPVIYEGPKDGVPREQWTLKPAHELLALKVCDVAMGSGAFLVQTCRFLGEKLVEAWHAAESRGQHVNQAGEVVADLNGGEPMPDGEEERVATARRLIAERALYGVDINPLAVELAKLSIWLVTLSKGKPFCFLDHQLKCGDSLIGLHDLRQLTQLKMDPNAKGESRRWAKDIEASVQQANDIRKRIHATRDNAIEDIENMRKLNEDANRVTHRLKGLADAICALAMKYSKSAKQLDNALASLDKTDIDVLLNGDDAAFDREHAAALRTLNEGKPAGKPKRRTFHWMLEFPEVFERGGFDAICGNPPFMGGQHLTGTFGTDYRDYLVQYKAEGRSGSADLVAYFYLNAMNLLKPNGCFGLIATDTIAQGDTRQVGLESMVVADATIYHATPSMKWPGKANLNVSIVHVHHGNDWRGSCVLKGESVDHISAYLSSVEEYSPQKLPENANQSYQGSIILGKGWLLSEDEAKAYIARDAKNAEVLFPYLGGDDLNSTNDQRATRWVINFFDWPLDRDAEGMWCDLNDKDREKAIKSGHVPADYPGRVASDFPELLDIVREKVKPERDKNNRACYRDNWWQYAEKRPALYHAIGRGSAFALHPSGWCGDFESQYLITARVTKYFTPIITNDRSTIFMEKVVVLTNSNYSNFAYFSSNSVSIWVWKTSSRNSISLNFSPSDSYETLPFPSLYDAALDGLGHELEVARREVMDDRALMSSSGKRAAGKKKAAVNEDGEVVAEGGLTTCYNLYHDEARCEAKIERLRAIHRAIDEAVLRSYGWTDIALEHGFYKTEGLPENDCVRYTISPAAQREVLKRLFALNKERATAGAETQNFASLQSATSPAKRGRKKSGDEGGGALLPF